MLITYAFNGTIIYFIEGGFPLGHKWGFCNQQVILMELFLEKSAPFRHWYVNSEEKICICYFSHLDASVWQEKISNIIIFPVLNYFKNWSMLTFDLCSLYKYVKLFSCICFSKTQTNKKEILQNIEVVVWYSMQYRIQLYNNTKVVVVVVCMQLFLAIVVFIIFFEFLFLGVFYSATA